jgi:hypothetical protein
MRLGRAANLHHGFLPLIQEERRQVPPFYSACNARRIAVITKRSKALLPQSSDDLLAVGRIDIAASTPGYRVTKSSADASSAKKMFASNAMLGFNVLRCRFCDWRRVDMRRSEWPWRILGPPLLWHENWHLSEM